MKYSKYLLALATLSLGVLNAATTYDLSLTSPTWVGGQELKPGSYKLEVADGKAIFKSKKSTVEVPATVQEGEKKFSANELSTNDKKLTEIRVGGTKMKVSIGEGAATSTTSAH
jgi:hypothetical protein